MPGLYQSTNSLFVNDDNSNGQFTEPGTHLLSGTIVGSELQASAFPMSEFDSPAPTQWAVALTTDWGDADRFSALKSGDTLTVTVPQNSIDVGLNRVPGAVSPPVGVPAPAPLALMLAGMLSGWWRSRC